MTHTFSQFTGTIGRASEKGVPSEVDVVVVGSGGAGLMAALTAAKQGAHVLVVESRELVGGATGISAGAAWIPNHGFSTKQLKVRDDLDQARRYIYGQGRDQVLDHDLVEKFLETGPQVARYIEEHTPFGWIPTIWPDYRSDIDGASIGRALFPGPYSPEGLGEAAKFVRPALTTGMAKNPLPFWLLGGMGIDQAWLAGPALVGALLEAGLRAGVDVRVEAPAVRLLADDSIVSGVVVRADGVEHTVRAARGVVLASGGFESSTELTTTHLQAPFGVQVSPDGHDGIAVQLAEEIGADLTGMQDAWWMPGVQLPGEELEGRPLSRVFLGERALPHSIMVNSNGERFANEALAYDQFGAIMREVDPETGTMPNATAWLIFDQNYWDKFGIFGITPGGDVPDYLHRAETSRRPGTSRSVSTPTASRRRSSGSTPTPDGHATRSSSAARRSSTGTSGLTTPAWARTHPTPGSPPRPPRPGRASLLRSARSSTGSPDGPPGRTTPSGFGPWSWGRSQGSSAPCSTARARVSSAPSTRRPSTPSRSTPARWARSAGHGPTPAAVLSTPTAAPFPGSTRPATPAVPPPRASTEAPVGPSLSALSSATSPDSTPPSTAPAAMRPGSSTAHGTHQSPDHAA